MTFGFATKTQPRRMQAVARKRAIARGLIAKLPPLPSEKSKLAFAVEIAKRRLRQLERAKDSYRYVDARIPRVWENFAPLLNIQTGGTIAPFHPYDYQIELIKTIELNQNTVVCKSRQMGISETICSWLLMRALTEPGFSAVVFSKTENDAAQLGQRIRDMALSLGALCPHLTSDSQKRIAFRGLGKIYFLPVTARSARGIPSVSVVLFDEAAFIEGIDGVYQAAVPTLSMLGDRGKVVFNSTPNGKSGLYYRLLTSGSGEAKKALDACQDIGHAANNIVPFERLTRHTRSWQYKKWAKVFLHWRAHPIYGSDPAWAEKTREERQLTEPQWNQEYELGFAEGQSTVFKFELIERASRGIWEPYRSDRIYLAGIDPNFGGSDYFTMRVWDITSAPYRLAAQYRANHRTKDYNLEKSLELGDRYNIALLAVETNGGGKLVHEELVNARSGWTIEPVHTSNTSKLQNTDRLNLLLERDRLIFPSEPDENGNPAGEEYQHFTEKIQGVTRIREAESGKHDDTVMADAIAFSKLDLVKVSEPISASIGSVKQRKRSR